MFNSFEEYYEAVRKFNAASVGFKEDTSPRLLALYINAIERQLGSFCAGGWRRVYTK